ncbi:alpha/beta-hydrolase [Lophiostoma macrostomum CBS 122681]|uniref:Alpha/beta-hydrolase n=1 Tax=Lophiostoma macrostomum CBS 122681 TaxID=1314788 RepID=A0A6A6THY4_9PLEO|nr:alpha/beta-hydrolase [Lophiostoma macrostomum CBS 122681]
MSIAREIVFKAAEFLPSSIDESTHKLNQTLEKVTALSPRWYDVGPVEFRRKVYAGETQFPVPPLLPKAQDVYVPSRDSGREVPVRVYKPDKCDPSRGVYLYLHGGGFVMGSHRDQDEMLKTFANTYQMTAISVGYRLAPENPFPAGINDCVDVAEHLVDNAQLVFSAPLRVIGGASAGGNFAALATLQLLRSRPQHRLSAVLLINGIFDLTLNLPSTVASRPSVIVDRPMLDKFVDAYTAGASIEARRNPLMSPLYDDLQEVAAESPFGTLPPAMFTCGTGDPLLDDSLMMSVKWIGTGSEAVIKLYPGAPHMFTAFRGVKVADDAAADTAAFLKGKLKG